MSNDIKPIFGKPKTEPNWDKIAVGKTRSLMTAAFIEGFATKEGKLPPPSDENLDIITAWTTFCMSGYVRDKDQPKEPF